MDGNVLFLSPPHFLVIRQMSHSDTSRELSSVFSVEHQAKIISIVPSSGMSVCRAWLNGIDVFL